MNSIDKTKVFTTTTTDGQKLDNICENINIKNRESKYAQFDSTELFQALYIQQESKIAPVKNIALITEILPNGNGFMGLCLRFGLKAPLYLRGVNDELKIPESILTKRSEDAHNYLSGGSLDYTVDKITINHSSLKKPVEFTLFDKVEVLLEVDESRNHRNSVVMTLIQKLNTNVIAPQVKIATKEMMESVFNGMDQEGQTGDLPQNHQEQEKEQQLYGSKKKSLYNVIEKFKSLSINAYSN